MAHWLVASSIWIEGEGEFQGHVTRIANKSSAVAGEARVRSAG